MSKGISILLFIFVTCIPSLVLSQILFPVVNESPVPDLNLAWFTYEWSVKNVSLLQQNKIYVESPKFSSVNYKNLKFRLRLYLNGHTNTNRTVLHLIHDRDVNLDNTLRLLLGVNIMTSDSRIGNSYNSLIPLNPSGITDLRSSGYNLPELQDDALEISLWMSVPVRPDPTNTSTDSQPACAYSKDPESTDNFRRFLEDTRFSDVALLVEGQSLPAHRLILATKSPVFGALLGDEANTIEVPDFDARTMREALRYMYTGGVWELERTASDLWRLADIYKIQGLKNFCEETVCSQLTRDIVLDVLRPAHEKQVGKLKECATRFVVENLKDLANRPEFTDLMLALPQLAVDIIKRSVSDRN